MAKSSSKNSSNQLSILDKSKSKTQSKEQKRFDSLTKRIEDLELKLKNEEQKLNAAMHEYTNKVYPLEKSIIEKKSEFVFKIDEKSKKYKLTKKQREIISDVITMEMSAIFDQQEPTKEQEELYDKWAECSYKAEVKEQESFEREVFEASIKHVFNGQIDASDFEDTPEGHARMKERIEAYYEEKNNEV